MNLRDVLGAADPLRHERRPAEDERDRLRHAVVAATSSAFALPAHVRRPARFLEPATFASIVIVTIVVASAVWLRVGSTIQAAVRFEVRLAEDQPAPGLSTARVGNSNRVIYLHPDVLVTNGDIARSSVIPGDTPTHFWIDVRLNDAGAAKMRQATMNHLGKPVAILIDGDVVSAPTVKSPIGAAATISGDYTREDAQKIADGMRIAALL